MTATAQTYNSCVAKGGWFRRATTCATNPCPRTDGDGGTGIACCVKGICQSLPATVRPVFSFFLAVLSHCRESAQRCRSQGGAPLPPGASCKYDGAMCAGACCYTDRARVRKTCVFVGLTFDCQRILVADRNDAGWRREHDHQADVRRHRSRDVRIRSQRPFGIVFFLLLFCFWFSKANRRRRARAKTKSLSARPTRPFFVSAVTFVCFRSCFVVHRCSALPGQVWSKTGRVVCRCATIATAPNTSRRSAASKSAFALRDVSTVSTNQLRFRFVFCLVFLIRRLYSSLTTATLVIAHSTITFKSVLVSRCVDRLFTRSRCFKTTPNVMIEITVGVCAPVKLFTGISDLAIKFVV